MREHVLLKMCKTPRGFTRNIYSISRAHAMRLTCNKSWCFFFSFWVTKLSLSLFSRPRRFFRARRLPSVDAPLARLGNSDFLRLSKRRSHDVHSDIPSRSHGFPLAPHFQGHHPSPSSPRSSAFVFASQRTLTSDTRPCRLHRGGFPRR